MDEINKFLKEYNITLTDEQKKALEVIDGPIAMIAVPGSGKTTTMIARIGYLVKVKNVSVNRILAMTYTKKATEEMRERFNKIFNMDLTSGLFYTIHRFCYMVLKRYPNYLPYEINPNIVDSIISDTEKEKFIRNIIKEDFQKKTVGTDLVLEFIRIFTLYKNYMYEDSEIKVYKKEYNLYNEYLKENHLIDFDDMLVFTYDILKNHKDALEFYQSLFDYVMVDEAQDNSFVQSEIIKMLVSNTNNIFMVGDEDQTIYEFRGACPECLTEFAKDYEGAKVLYLSENFRSDKYIVDMANNLIKENNVRYPKNMFTNNSENKNAIKRVRTNNYNMAETIINIVKENRNIETAILFRLNNNTVPVIFELIENNIPFKIKELTEGFFDSNTIYFIKNLLDFIDNRKDLDAFLGCANNLDIYMSKKLRAYLKDNFNPAENRDIIDVLLDVPNIEEYQKKKIETLIDNLNIFKEIKDMTSKLYEIHFAYSSFFNEHGNETDFNVLTALSKPDDTRESLFKRIYGLKKQFLSLEENSKKDKTSLINILTIHSSKGLEFDRVIMADASCMPISKNHPIKNRVLESERRVFYVGMTRAKKELYFIEDVTKYGIFINEIFNPAPKKNLSYTTKTYIDENAGVEKQTNMLTITGGIKVPIKTTEKEEEISDVSISDFQVGVTLVHKKLGKGKLISIQNLEGNTLYEFEFENGRKSKFAHSNSFNLCRLFKKVEDDK